MQRKVKDMEDPVEMSSNTHVTAVTEQVKTVRDKHSISRDNYQGFLNLIKDIKLQLPKITTE